MKCNRTFFGALAVFATLLLPIVSQGADARANPAHPTYQPPIEPASDAAEEAMSGFKLPASFQIDLFAGEPLLANPVQFYVDNQGRILLVETYRQGDPGGVVDNRGHMYWLDDDLASERVEDRRAMILRHRPEMVDQWTEHSDLVRILEDTTGDGKADRSQIFADGFNDLLDGTGAGVISRDGKVWFTNIPHLWLLQDTNGDGYADDRQSLSYGYGVNVALRGHDLHGLVFGPDGKLYFSLGDRGYNVTTAEGRQLRAPKEGAVFRCNLDGSDLEVFATGLRNPQDLAFDNHGNLFTGDNNSDATDRARWVYVVEGGDSGWRMPYQTLSDRGPFNREELWKPRFEGQPAWHIPPIANIGDGPSGLAFDPGTGMPEAYKGYFFLCDFRANPANSGIWAITNEPDGAGFKLADHHPFLWNIVATDISTGPDSSLYVTDWVRGWNGVNRGRVYRLFTPELAADNLAREAREILHEGMRERSVRELTEWLGHPNQRVRQESQFELARRGDESIIALQETTATSPTQLARIHAIWALWQLVDDHRNRAVSALLPLLTDADPEIRAQAARVLGDKAAQRALNPLLEMLDDPEPRPVYFAALGLGRIGNPQAINPVVEMLRRNNDKDLYLRHAGVMALTGIGKKHDRQLLALTSHENFPVRLGVLLALRRLNHPEVARFLDDSDPFLVAEAASAINDDTLIEEAQPALARLIRRDGLTGERILRRTINANFRLGGLEQAKDVAAFAARAEAPAAMRVEAIAALRDWHEPSSRDRVTGFWRPLTERPKQWPVAAAEAVLDELLANTSPPEVREAAMALVFGYGIKSRAPDLLAMVTDETEKLPLRRAGLNALGHVGDQASLAEAVKTAIASPAPELRQDAYALLVQLDSKETVTVLEALLASEATAPLEKQVAFKTLAEADTPAADAILIGWVRKFVADEDSVPPEAQFELIQAAKKLESPQLRPELDRFVERRSRKDPKDRPELLVGGDTALGRNVVFNHQTASCQRCHIIDDNGVSSVGPDLRDVGNRLDRAQLLESLLLPNAVVSAGYGAAIFKLTNGETVSGSIAQETDRVISVTTPDGATRTLERNRIASQDGPYSAMPPMGHILTEEELRAVVAYLASLKGSAARQNQRSH